VGIEKIATLGYNTPWNNSRWFLFDRGVNNYFSQQIQIIGLIV